MGGHSWIEAAQCAVACLRFDIADRLKNARQDSEAIAKPATFSALRTRRKALFGLNLGPLGNSRAGEMPLSVLKCRLS
jgi:hypothetical protein